MAYDSIEATDGDYVSALFVEPFMGPEYPHIYIAVGDYDVQKKEAGQDNALGGILRSVAHELTHYYRRQRQMCIRDSTIINGLTG